MISWKSSSALLLLVAQLASAWNPATDRSACNRRREPCATSFIWCSSNADSVRGCYHPPNTYPWFNRDFASNDAAVLNTVRYNLSWQNFNRDYPVQVTLNFGYNQDNDARGFGSGNWTRNITDANFMEFTFAEIVNEFPTPTSNFTPAEVYGILETSYGSFSLSQPEAPPATTSSASSNAMPTRAFTDQFIVFDSRARIFLETQADIAREAEYNKWAKGVGIGVGVGVPLLLIAALLIGWLFGKRTSRKVNATSDAKLSTSS